MNMRIVAMVALLALGAVPAAAQVSYGEISGYVYDEQGAVIAETKITVTSPALMGERVVTSGSTGRYRIINLPPGIYQLKVEKASYKTKEVQNVEVRAGRTASLNVTLPVGEFGAVVTITQEAPLIDVKSSQRGLNISGEFFKRVPIHYNRQWDSVWSLVPGTITTGQYTTTTPYVQVHGATPFQNVFNLDGMRIGSMNENVTNVFFNVDIIEEVSVVTNGLDAATSAGYGGYINVVTKSGGNEFHGSAAFTFQPEDWNWSNIEGGKAAKREIYLPDLSLGGPIVKDKTWFFASYRYVHQNEAYAYTAANIAALTRLELEVPDQPRADRSHQVFAKVTHALMDKHNLVGTFNYDEGHQDNDSMYGTGSVNTGLKVDKGGKYGNLSLESAWGQNFTTTLKASYYLADQDAVNVSGPDEPTIYRYSSTYLSGGNRYGSGTSGFYNGYYYGFPGSEYHNERMEIRGDARLFVENLIGQHDIAFGFAALPVQEFTYDFRYANGPQRINTAKNAAGQWVPFYEQQYSVLRSTWNSTEQENYAGYVQDTWTVNDRLTINAGVRIENQKDGQLIDVTGVNPNIGASYALSGDYSDAVRFSYGLRRFLFSAQDVYSSVSGGDAGYVERWDNDMDGTWDYINTYIGSPDTAFDPSGYNLDPDLEPAWSHNWQVGYNRLLPWAMKMDVAYNYKEFRGAIASVNTNLIWNGDEFGGYVDPTVNSVYYRTNNTWNYTYTSALELALSREFSQGWQIMGSYTMMTTGEKGDWNPDWAWAHMHPEDWYETSETRHIVRFAASAILPWDFTFSGNLLWQTAPAENPLQLNYGTGVEGVPSTFTLSNGRVITHPFYQTSPYYQPKSEREVTLESLTIINLGIGKDFTLFGYRFQTQVQAFNAFNYDSPTYYGNSHNIVDKNGNRLYVTTPGGIQSPRVVQAFIKWVF